MSAADPLSPVLAYRTGNFAEAQALAAYLEEAGVEVQVVGDFLSGALSGLNMGRAGDNEVWVAEKDEAAAVAAIAEWRQENAARDLESSEELANPDESAPSSALPSEVIYVGAAVAIIWTIWWFRTFETGDIPSFLSTLLGWIFFTLFGAACIKYIYRVWLRNNRAANNSDEE